jgi:hypothetical protein
MRFYRKVFKPKATVMKMADMFSQLVAASQTLPYAPDFLGELDESIEMTVRTELTVAINTMVIEEISYASKITDTGC